MKLATLLITGVVVLCITGSALIAILFVETSAAKDDLVYAFEVVRHGARAPLLGASLFNVGPEMLTP